MRKDIYKLVKESKEQERIEYEEKLKLEKERKTK